MRRLQLMLIALFVCCVALAQRQPLHSLRVVANNNDARRAVGQYVSVERLVGDTIYATANQIELEQLKDAGLCFELLRTPALPISRALGVATTVEEMAQWNLYPSYDVYVQMLRGLQRDYPSLCTLDSIGTSVLGRQLYMLRITNHSDTSGSKPKYLYSSTIHGDELVGFVLMLRMAHYLCEGYATNDTIRQLLDAVQIFVCPHLNPDGTYGTNDASISGRQRRNYNGVDLNRNFPHPKNSISETKAQPETQAVVRLIQRHNFAASVDLHTGAEVICYPWDYWYLSEWTHPDIDWFKQQCRAYADTVHAHAPSGYFTQHENGVTHAASWYPITGSQAEYVNYYCGGKELTVELSITKTPDPSSLPQLWNSNRLALLNLAQAVRYGISGTVCNAQGEALVARVSIVNHDGDLAGASTDAHSGAFHRPIAPGSYQLLVESDGYLPKLHGVTVSDFGQMVYANVVLERPSVEFCVVDAADGSAVVGALVVLGSDSLRTDARGRVLFAQVPCSSVFRLYSVEADDFTSVADSLVVSSDMVVRVALGREAGDNDETPENDKVQHTTGLTSTDQIASINLRPNPFSTTLTIEGEGIQRVSIYSAMGQNVASFEVTNSLAQWHPDYGLPRGMYWVVVQHDSGRTVYKVVYQ